MVKEEVLKALDFQPLSKTVNHHHFGFQLTWLLFQEDEKT